MVESFPLSATLPTTAEDLPYLAPAEGRCELAAGRLVREPPPGAEHGWIAGRVLVHLGRFVLDRGLGRVYAAETGFVLARDPDTVRCPDAAYLSAERLRQASYAGPYLVGAPDLAVEVVSPGDGRRQVAAKVAEYLAAGGISATGAICATASRAVWVIDPRAETVVVHTAGGARRTLRRSDVIDGAPVLPGLRIAVDDLVIP